MPVPEGIVGASPTSAYPALKTLSTEFFKVYLSDRSEKQLQGDRLEELNNSEFQFKLLHSLTEAKLNKAINQ